MSVTTRAVQVTTTVDRDVAQCDVCGKTAAVGTWKSRTGMEAGWITFVVSMGAGQAQAESPLDACSFACLAIYAASRDEAQKVTGGANG